MGMRIAGYAIAVAVTLRRSGADIALAQEPPWPTCQLQSLEWLVANADVVVRGVVVETSTTKAEDGMEWGIVTLDVVGETLKGEKAQALRFAVQPKSILTIDEWKKSKTEMMWILNRFGKECVSLHGVDLHTNYLSVGRLPVIPLVQDTNDGLQLARPSTIDSKLLKTSDDPSRRFEKPLSSIKEMSAFGRALSDRTLSNCQRKSPSVLATVEPGILSRSP